MCCDTMSERQVNRPDVVGTLVGTLVGTFYRKAPVFAQIRSDFVPRGQVPEMQKALQLQGFFGRSERI